MQRPDSAIGKVIDGYKILDVLGQGGMGIVYKAEDVALSRQVALKMINPELASQDTFLRRFQLEAKALARVDSPYIVGVHALRKAGEHVFIVMEFVDGWTLSDEMNNGTLDSKRAYSLLKQLLQAFSHAHGVGVIHRDIKPSNIMISRTGRVKVTDFGLAKLRREDGMTTVTQGIAGTARYMSPEQVLGKKIDHRSDIYSLGMTLYHMYAGKLPFEPDEGTYSILRRVVEEEFVEVSQINAKIPQALSGIIAKAIAKSPDDRYQSAEEMLSDLERVYGQGQPKAGDTVNVKPKSGSEKRRSPLVFAAIALVAVLIYPVYHFVTGNDSGNGGEQSVGSQTEGTPSTNEVGTSTTNPDSSVTELQPNYAYPPISTSPSGATVWIDGDSIGVTPLPNAEIRAGMVDVEVELEGYEPQSRTVALDAGDITAIQFTLQLIETEQESSVVENNPIETNTTTETESTPVLVSPPKPDIAKATMQLLADPEGLIYVNGEEFVNESIKEWQVGLEYTVTFVDPGNPEIRRDTTFTLSDLSGVNITCYFKHRLSVQTWDEEAHKLGDWAFLKINGEDFQTTPLDNYEFSSGTYVIELSRFDYTIDRSARTIILRPSFDPAKMVHVERFQIRPE